MQKKIVQIGIKILLLLSAIFWLFQSNITPFEIEGRLVELLGIGWQTSVILTRVLLAFPLVIAIFFALGKNKVAFVLTGILALLFMGDAASDFEVFTTELIKLTFTAFWPSFALALLVVVHFFTKPATSTHPIIITLLVVGFCALTCYKYKIYEPDIYLKQGRIDDLPAFHQIPKEVQQKIKFQNGYFLVGSSECGTCYTLLKSWSLLQRMHPEMEDFTMFFEDENELPKLITDLNYTGDYLAQPFDTIVNFSGSRVPVVFEIRNGAITKKWLGDGIYYPHFDKIKNNEQLP